MSACFELHRADTQLRHGQPKSFLATPAQYNCRAQKLAASGSQLPYAAAVHDGADHTVGLGTDLLWQSVVTGISIHEIQLGKRRIRN